MLWPPQNVTSMNEEGVMLEICSEILAPLCAQVVLEKWYSLPLSRRSMPSLVSTSHIGIGTNHT